LISIKEQQNGRPAFARAGRFIAMGGAYSAASGE